MRIPTHQKEEIAEEMSGKYAETTAQWAIQKKINTKYVHLLNQFGQKGGFEKLVLAMKNRKIVKEGIELKGEEAEEESKKAEKGKEKRKGGDVKDDDGDLEMREPLRGEVVRASLSISKEEEEEEVVLDEGTVGGKGKGKGKVIMERGKMTHNQFYHFLSFINHAQLFLTADMKRYLLLHLTEIIRSWYLDMPLSELKTVNRATVHRILQRWQYYLHACDDPKEELKPLFEEFRLEIAFRWLQTSSLERKITAMKEFKEYIDAVNYKNELEIKKARGERVKVLRSYNILPKSRQNFNLNIFCSDIRSVSHFLANRLVLKVALADDTHEDLVKRSFDIMKFLAQTKMLKKHDLDTLWGHTTRHKSFTVSLSFSFFPLPLSCTCLYRKRCSKY